MRIPAGVDDWSQIIMRGQGDSGSRGGLSGNLYITLTVKAHEFFLRHGDDIIYELPVNIAQAAFGDDVEVPSLVGKTKIKVPAGSQTGKLFRLKGQGISHLNKGGRGDQLILLVTVTPDSLNEKQRQLLKELAASFTSANLPPPEKWKNWLDGVKSAFGD